MKYNTISYIKSQSIWSIDKPWPCEFDFKTNSFHCDFPVLLETL